MTARDWQMLTEVPPEWDIFADISEWMLPPYSDADILKWYPSRERKLD